VRVEAAAVGDRGWRIPEYRLRCLWVPAVVVKRCEEEARRLELRRRYRGGPHNKRCEKRTCVEQNMLCEREDAVWDKTRSTDCTSGRTGSTACASGESAPGRQERSSRRPAGRGAARAGCGGGARSVALDAPAHEATQPRLRTGHVLGKSHHLVARKVMASSSALVRTPAHADLCLAWYVIQISITRSCRGALRGSADAGKANGCRKDQKRHPDPERTQPSRRCERSAGVRPGR